MLHAKDCQPQTEVIYIKHDPFCVYDIQPMLVIGETYVIDYYSRVVYNVFVKQKEHRSSISLVGIVDPKDGKSWAYRLFQFKLKIPNELEHMFLKEIDGKTR